MSRKVWKIETAVRAAKKAKEETEGEFNSERYQEYYNKYKSEIPSRSFITNRYLWSEFIKLINGEPAKSKEIIKTEEHFCELCRYHEKCEEELENCQYWREWNGNKRENFG